MIPPVILHPKQYEELTRLADELGIPEAPEGTRGWRQYQALLEVSRQWGRDAARRHAGREVEDE